jgi:hypothetical protein
VRFDDVERHGGTEAAELVRGNEADGSSADDKDVDL